MKAHLLAAVLATTIFTAAPAFAQSYSGGSAVFSGIGSDQTAFPGTIFDQVTFGAVTGTYTGPGTYNLNTVTFLAGINRNDAFSFSGIFALTGLFAGNPVNYNISYTGTIGSDFDTLNLGGNSFIVDGQQITFNPLTLTSDGSLASGLLSVTVSAVPEPAAWAMMIAGFGMVGFGLRSRRTSVRVTYA